MAAVAAHLYLLAQRHIIFRARVAYCAHHRLQRSKLCRGGGAARAPPRRPVSNHQRLLTFRVRQRRPRLLCDKRQERVPQAQHPVKHVHEHAARLRRRVGIAAVQARLGGLNVPVGKIRPEEVVREPTGLAKLVAVVCSSGLIDHPAAGVAL